MARQKKQSGGGGGGSPAWMATFSDLMNLLLCFFVLLFAFSSTDAEKFAEVAASLKSSFSIFESGAMAIGEGKLVSQGVSQMEALSQYFSEMEMVFQDDSDDSEEEMEYEKKQLEEAKEATEDLYEELIEAADEKNVSDSISVSMDENYQYVRISMNGAVLFDSGSADIKKEAVAIIDKIGDILKTYDKHLIKIEGHTDNIPMSGNRKYESNMWLSTARATRVFEYLVNTKGLNPKTLEASGRGEYEPLGDNATPEGRAKNRRVEIKIYTDTD